MKIIVGSTAVVYHGIAFRKPSDIDIWVSDESEKENGDCKVLPLSILEMIPTTNGYATMNALYTIKCSHLGWSNPKWNKHKIDVLHFKSIGCVLLLDLYNALVNYWKAELGNKTFLNLNKNKDAFFTDFVTYAYDHDWLHKLVSYPAEPTYTLCLRNDSDVLIDKDKFFSLSVDQQLSMFREEITVIAIERWLVNPKLKVEICWTKAYKLALEKTITQLTKNWATEFIVLNIEHFYKPQYSYFKHAIETLRK